MPKAPRKAFTTPESLLSIHAEIDGDTSSGNSHGTRKSARSVAASGKRREKKTARASPIANWNRIEPIVKTAVFQSAGPKVGLRNTST